MEADAESGSHKIELRLPKLFVVPTLVLISAVEARLQAAKRLRRTGLLADKRARVLRAARATYLELECAALSSACAGCPTRQSQAGTVFLYEPEYFSIYGRLRTLGSTQLWLTACLRLFSCCQSGASQGGT